MCMYVCPRGEKGKGLVTCLQVLEKRKGGGVPVAPCTYF